MMSIRNLAHQVLSNETRLDVLICNGSVSLDRYRHYIFRQLQTLSPWTGIDTRQIILRQVQTLYSCTGIITKFLDRSRHSTFERYRHQTEYPYTGVDTISWDKYSYYIIGQVQTPYPLTGIDTISLDRYRHYILRQVQTLYPWTGIDTVC